MKSKFIEKNKWLFATLFLTIVILIIPLFFLYEIKNIFSSGIIYDYSILFGYAILSGLIILVIIFILNKYKLLYISNWLSATIFLVVLICVFGTQMIYYESGLYPKVTYYFQGENLSLRLTCVAENNNNDFFLGVPVVCTLNNKNWELIEDTNVDFLNNDGKVILESRSSSKDKNGNYDKVFFNLQNAESIRLSFKLKNKQTGEIIILRGDRPIRFLDPFKIPAEKRNEIILNILGLCSISFVLIPTTLSAIKNLNKND